jgi:hypothetical protein
MEGEIEREACLFQDLTDLKDVCDVVTQSRLFTHTKKKRDIPKTHKVQKLF